MNKEHHVEVIKKITETNIEELKAFATHLIEINQIHEAYLVTQTMNNLNVISMLVEDFLDEEFLEIQSNNKKIEK